MFHESSLHGPTLALSASDWPLHLSHDAAPEPLSLCDSTSALMADVLCEDALVKAFAESYSTSTTLSSAESSPPPPALRTAEAVETVPSAPMTTPTRPATVRGKGEKRAREASPEGSSEGTGPRSSRARRSPFEPATGVGLPRAKLVEMSSADLEAYIAGVSADRDLTEAEMADVRAMRKLVKNRENAAHSRARRRNYVEELERRIADLEAEKAAADKRAAALAAEVDALPGGPGVLQRVFSLHGALPDRSAAGAALMVLFAFAFMLSAGPAFDGAAPALDAPAFVLDADIASGMGVRDLLSLQSSLTDMVRSLNASKAAAAPPPAAPNPCPALGAVRPFLEENMPALLRVIDLHPACRYSAMVAAASA